MPINNKIHNPQIQNQFLKDIDKSVISWLEKDFPLTIDGRKTPVLFVSRERWSQISKEKAIRDEHGQIILPVISVRRLDPEIKKERNYPQNDATEISFYRRVASKSYNAEEALNNLNDYQQGVPDSKYIFAKDKPVFEILRIPFPSIAEIAYEIILWTSYISHQNIEIELFLNEFAGGRTFFFNNKEKDGYSHFVKLKNIQDQSNTEEFTNKERILKTKFSIDVLMYLIDKKKVKISRTLQNIRLTIKEAS